jgi:hypothetical protein
MQRCKNNLIGHYIFGLRSFLSLSHFHRDLLPFFQGFETFHLDCRVVDENIRPTFALDETKSLVVIEPFNGSSNSFA